MTVRDGKVTHVREYRHAGIGAGVRDGACKTCLNLSRQTLRFINILAQSFAPGADAGHFRHVLGTTGAQRGDRFGQA